MNMNVQTLMLPIAIERTEKPPLKLSTPVVTGGTGEAARAKMNEAIKHEEERLTSSQGYPSPDVQEMDGTFELKTNQRGVLSLSLLNYVFTGGAHGNTIQKSLTFDADTGRSYKLADLFKPGADYKKKLNALIEAQIKSRKLPLLSTYPGIAEDQDFYIADKALVIYFQLYDLVPYAWGFPYFPISVYAIQDIIDEDGPLGAMMY